VSACLSVPSCATAAAGLLLSAMRAGDIDRQWRAAGGQQQWRRSRSRSMALSSKCEQCNVYSRHRRLSTNLFTMDCYDIELKTDLLEFDIITVTAVINYAFTELARNFDSKKTT